MIKIRVEYLLDKNVEDVFDAITDHENYERYPGFDSSELLEPGKTEKNGEGALRLLGSGRATFKERITCYERPSRMSYHCEEVRPLPIHHERGDITMEPIDGKTKVVWISEARLKIPIIGSLLGKLMQRRLSRAFLAVLKHIEAS
jgi:uncharacterized protein YndB with AHSA1/START domain